MNDLNRRRSSCALSVLLLAAFAAPQLSDARSRKRDAPQATASEGPTIAPTRSQESEPMDDLSTSEMESDRSRELDMDRENDMRDEMETGGEMKTKTLEQQREEIRRGRGTTDEIQKSEPVQEPNGN